MQVNGRFFILLPVTLTLVSFVLSMLALFAGQKQGFMEDYAVVRVSAEELSPEEVFCSRQAVVLTFTW